MRAAAGVLACAAGFAGLVQAAAQVDPPVGVSRAPRVSTPFRIDGRLDEPAWSAALITELPHEVYPGDNEPASVRTEMRICYDADNLYIGFVAADPDPASIRAHLSDRDQAFRDDLVGVVIDAFNDERRGFAFLVNPLGVQLDAALGDSGDGSLGIRNSTGAPTESYDWDAIWDAAGRVGDAGFQVEMAIPFRALRFPRGAGDQTWGILAVRVRPRTLRRRFASAAFDRDRNCYFCQIGKVVGFADAEPGRNIELDPTLTARSSSEYDSAGADLRDEDVELGLTAQWGATPNLTVSATLNPDFSQVEADAAQLASNRRFALLFAEKRPFFLEGADFFETPEFAVFSRTIVEPDYGIKLTGKQGRHAIGAFIARDERTDLLFPANEESRSLTLDQPNTSIALRYRRDVGSTSTVGVLATAREGPGYYNRLVGIDGNLRVSSSDSIVFQALHSETEYPLAVSRDPFGNPTGLGQPEGDFSGNAFYLEYEHLSRDWNWFVVGEQRDRQFRADLGFLPRVDTRAGDARIERVFWGEPGSFLTRSVVGGEYQRAQNLDGRLTDELIAVDARMDGPYQSFLLLEAYARESVFAGRLFELDGARFFFNIRPSGTFTSSLNGGIGSEIDVDNVREARFRQIEPEMTLNLGRKFFTQLRHNRQRLMLRDQRLLSERLTQGQFNYHFGVRSFVRAIIQHRITSRNLELFTCLDAPADERCSPNVRDEQLFSQLLFSYKLNPRTVLFAGYTETRAAIDDRSLERTDRTVFLKFGYAWLL